jgi:hypothetical protein
MEKTQAKKQYDGEGREIFSLEIDENTEFITVTEEFSENEGLREKFPYELCQGAAEMLNRTKTLYKTPRTSQDWHKHYTKKAQMASDVAEEYFQKASFYKKQAKQALKGRL